MSTPKTNTKAKINTLEALEARHEALKKERGSSVYMISVPLDDEDDQHAVCYLRKPDRMVLKRVAPLLSQGKEIEAAEIILNMCWIEGDEEIKTNDDLFFPVQMQLAHMIEWRQASLSKK